ncbi:MAG: hypothetical protein IPM29_07385 [Planctomycetes bacterium]|nr:hypothetical protein [Planctomycetota bacterium]
MRSLAALRNLAALLVARAAPAQAPVIGMLVGDIHAGPIAQPCDSLPSLLGARPGLA